MTDQRHASPLLAAGAHPTGFWVLFGVAAAVWVCVAAAGVTWELQQRGRREPALLRAVAALQNRAVDWVKRPITVAMLDEVAEVLRSGHYTRNIAAALDENHRELKAMIREKVLADSLSQRSLALLPFSPRLIDELADAGLRVMFEVLLDPRTDELVSDVLRDNIDQIKNAVAAAGP